MAILGHMNNFLENKVNKIKSRKYKNSKQPTFLKELYSWSHIHLLQEAWGAVSFELLESLAPILQR